MDPVLVGFGYKIEIFTHDNKFWDNYKKVQYLGGGGGG